MKLKGKVLNASIETKVLVGKDGLKAEHKIGHILMLVSDDGVTQALNVRSFDNPDFMLDSQLPEIGKDWTTPPVRKYECYDGNVAEVSI